VAAATGSGFTGTRIGNSTQAVTLRRLASINDLPIAEADRQYHWPLRRRPDDHADLSVLGL
jgi:uncharacterized protein